MLQGGLWEPRSGTLGHGLAGHLGDELTGTPMAVFCAPWGQQNAFDVFALGRDGAVKHKWWDWAQWGPTVTGWADLVGRFRGSPVAVRWGSMLSLFWVGPDGALQGTHWTCTQLGP